METENTLSSSELLPSIRADGDQMRCSYMLPHKKRYCRMLVKAGRRFCGEHIVFDPQDQTRIVCPLDPKHTVYRTDLKDHLATKCNGRLPSDLWIQENVNVVPSEERLGESQNEKGPEDGRLNCSEEDTARVAKIIEEAYSKLAAEAISDACLKTEAIENFMEANENQNETHKKHLVQQSSIIGNLAARHLLNNQDDSCFIELGAGKAQLTYWLAKTIPNCRFLLIDRSGARNKYDNKAMQENAALKIERVRCSIEHLDLSKVSSIENSRSLVAVCKHFCGKATDCGVICLQNAIKNGVNLSGFALAPCCHHKSDYTQYVGKRFLHEIGIATKDDFNVLRLIATWATCGFASSRSTEDESRWSIEQKETLGRKAKALLEIGRAKCLEELGYDVTVSRYVPESISPENLLIIGTKRK